MLFATERGRKTLEALVNTNDKDFLSSFESNIEKVYKWLYGQRKIRELVSHKKNEKIAIDGIDAHTEIVELAYSLIDDRIANMDLTNMELLAKEFEKIKMDECIVRMASNHTGLFPMNLDRETTVSSKLTALEQIIGNGEMTNIEKLGIISQIKGMRSQIELIDFIVDNNIQVDFNQITRLSDEEIERYNTENTSNGMRWDNTEIVSYIQENKHELQMPIQMPRFSIIRVILDKALSKFKSITSGKENLKLPEGESKELMSQVSNIKNEKPWDLSNWGIDKNQFMVEHAEHMEEYIESTQITETRETTEIEQDEGLTMHSGHEGGFER